jgi:hypothetical protein
MNAQNPKRIGPGQPAPGGQKNPRQANSKFVQTTMPGRPAIEKHDGGRTWQAQVEDTIERADRASYVATSQQSITAGIEVGGSPQAQSLSGDIAFGQRDQAARIEANVPVDIQGASQFRRGLQPVSSQ